MIGTKCCADVKAKGFSIWACYHVSFAVEKQEGTCDRLRLRLFGTMVLVTVVSRVVSSSAFKHVACGTSYLYSAEFKTIGDIALCGKSCIPRVGPP